MSNTSNDKLISHIPSHIKLGSLETSNTALFICDLQEKFSSVILYFDNLIKNTNKLVSFSFFFYSYRCLF